MGTVIGDAHPLQNEVREYSSGLKSHTFCGYGKVNTVREIIVTLKDMTTYKLKA